MITKLRQLLCKDQISYDEQTNTN